MNMIIIKFWFWKIKIIRGGFKFLFSYKWNNFQNILSIIDHEIFRKGEGKIYGKIDRWKNLFWIAIKKVKYSA